jgi:hypothetical protein
MVDTSERADILELVQGGALSSGRHSPTWRTPARGQTYRSRYRQVDTIQHGGHQREGRHTGAGTDRQTQSNMADTRERAYLQEQGTDRQTQSNMVDTSEKADIQEQVQTGRHSPIWRALARGQTYSYETRLLDFISIYIFY